MGSTLVAFGLQARVIGALLLRDIGSRHGGEAYGMLWLLAEPIVITLVVVFVHAAGAVGGSGNSVPIMVIFLSGYMPHFLFRHGGQVGNHAIKQDGGLLYHRQVHYIDLIVAKLLTEVVSDLLASILIFFACYWMGLIEMPHSLAWIYLGIALHVWYTIAICFLFTGGALMFPLVARLFQPFSLLMLGPFAAFFMLNWVSPSARTALLWFPPATATEVIRHGFLGDTYPTYYDIPYAVFCLLVLTLVSLVVLSKGRRGLEY